MTKSLILDELNTKAEVILYLDATLPRILPKTTVKKLMRAVKPHADRAMHIEHLREAIRLAELHAAKFEATLAEDAELEMLLKEDAELEALADLIESTKLEAIDLHNFLADPQNARHIHPSKREVTFRPFLEDLEAILAGNVINEQELIDVEAWVRRAKDFKVGIENKRRQAPMQTVKRAA